MPSTISYLISLRIRYDGYGELLEVPPEEHWDYPHLIRKHMEQLYPTLNKNKSNISVDEDEIEE